MNGSLVKGLFATKFALLWWFLLLAVPVLIGWIIVSDYQVEAVKQYAVNLQHKCDQVSDCSRNSDLPWAIGKVTEVSGKNKFSIRIEALWSKDQLVGGVNRTLIHNSNSDGGWKMVAKYKDGKWIEHE
jgi:hypothetical protein